MKCYVCNKNIGMVRKIAYSLLRGKIDPVFCSAECEKKNAEPVSPKVISAKSKVVEKLIEGTNSCKTCNTPLSKRRKSYCNVTCKNSDKEGAWRKNLLRNGYPQKPPKKKVLNAKIEKPKKTITAPNVSIDPPASVYALPSCKSKYNSHFNESSHRKRIREFSKW